MMKKVMVSTAFVLVLLLTLVVGIGATNSNLAHAATASAAHVQDTPAPPTATVLPLWMTDNRLVRVYSCAGGMDGFFNVRADYATNWDCFANHGYADVEIWGASQVCTGDNRGFVILTDNDGQKEIDLPEKFQCYSLGGGYHKVTRVVIF